MSNKQSLRPVEVVQKGKKIKGYFHRFIYSSCNYCSITQALIELEDGRLRYFDPYFVQFTDRDTSAAKRTKERNLSHPQNRT